MKDGKEYLKEYIVLLLKNAMRTDKINPYDLRSVAKNLNKSQAKDYDINKAKDMKIFDTTEGKVAESRLKKEIKEAIQSTLVIDNKTSIDLAVQKIMDIIVSIENDLFR